MAKVRIHVFLKPGVLDVQGKAVEGALKGLGLKSVSVVLPSLHLTRNTSQKLVTTHTLTCQVTPTTLRT